MKQIRILLIEDNRICRECISAVINCEPDIKVLAATDGSVNILQLTHQFKPDVLLVAIGPGNRHDARSVKSVSRALPGVKVIAMGIIPAQWDVIPFVQAGVSGFITNNATRKDCVETIRKVAGGTSLFPSSLNDAQYAQGVDHPLNGGMINATKAGRVTKREREIIELIEVGLSNKEIACRLNIATYTVKSHVHNIMEKLGVHSRLQIAAWVHKNESFSRQAGPSLRALHDVPALSQFQRRVSHGNLDTGVPRVPNRPSGLSLVSS